MNMYARTPAPGLGFSLKPPSWLVNDVKSLVAGKPASVPLPSGGSVTVTPRPATNTALNAANTQLQAAVEEIPGGWLTIAAAVAAIFVLPKVLRGRR
jgi:hypothetical protein